MFRLAPLIARGLALVAAEFAVEDNWADYKEPVHRRAGLQDKKAAGRMGVVEDCSWNRALVHRPPVAIRLSSQLAAAEDKVLERTRSWLRLKCQWKNKMPQSERNGGKNFA